MAQYKTDLRDIYYNLFELRKVQDYAEGYEANDLKDIIEQFDKFIGNEVYPTRTLGDSIGVKLIDGQVKVPECFHKANQGFYENGWFGLGYPEAIGGFPAPESIQVTATAIVTAANVSFSMYFGLTRAAMNVVLAVGTPEQKNLYIPKMMSGEWGGTMCLTEAGAGSDVGALKTVATPSGEGKYKIKGVKIFISSGDNDLYENIVHLVLARTPGAPEGTKGLSLFIVPKKKVNTDGTSGESNDVHCTKIEEKMGIHAQATCELTFGDNNNCEGYLIGGEGNGIMNMFLMMNEARLMCGIQGEAQANLAYMLTEQYVKERVQFGKEIVHHPDVKRMMLKMRAMSRGMRGLNLYVASLFDRAHAGKDKSLNDEIALLTPICKAYCSDKGFDVSVDAVQVHGGYGFCTEYGIEQFVRDTKIATIYEGTNGIQAIDFVMRKILKDNGKTFTSFAEKIGKTMKTAEAKEFKDERAMMKAAIKDGQKVMAKYGKMAKEGNFEGILSSSTDFLRYCGHIVVSWIHLESALLAKKNLASAEGDDKKYYQSKIDDFRVFTQHYLVESIGLAQSVLGFKEDLTKIEV